MVISILSFILCHTPGDVRSSAYRFFACNQSMHNLVILLNEVVHVNQSWVYKKSVQSLLISQSMLVHRLTATCCHELSSS